MIYDNVLRLHNHSSTFKIKLLTKIAIKQSFQIMNKLLITLLCIANFSSCISSKSLSAEDAEQRAEKILDRMDDNNDDQISRTEISFPMTEKIFDEHDTDSNGYLDRSEIINYLMTK